MRRRKATRESQEGHILLYKRKTLLESLKSCYFIKNDRRKKRPALSGRKWGLNKS